MNDRLFYLCRFLTILRNLCRLLTEGLICWWLILWTRPTSFRAVVSLSLVCLFLSLATHHFFRALWTADRNLCRLKNKNDLQSPLKIRTTNQNLCQNVFMLRSKCNPWSFNCDTTSKETNSPAGRGLWRRAERKPRPLSSCHSLVSGWGDKQRDSSHTMKRWSTMMPRH